MLDQREGSGWRGAALVAATYVYFLIFAQFAFLGRLAECNLNGASLSVVLAAMAAGGILLSLIAPRVDFIPSPGTRLRIAFLACAVAALASLLTLGLYAAIVIAFLIGAALGLLTVTLVTHLRLWAGSRNPILRVGLGTGIGYFVCNIPALFTATPKVQAIVAAAISVLAFLVVVRPVVEASVPPTKAHVKLPFLRPLASFAALVWLDSAAFFIIQHTPALKAGTWMGAVHLWINAFLHLGAALAAAWLLQRYRSGLVLAAGFASLGCACLLLQDSSLALTASLFYPVGVSLYSVALVAYPSFLTGAATARQRGIQAGWIYAVAGWVASALGIGMGQNLGRVPVGFVVIAGLVVLLPALVPLIHSRARELLALGGTLALAFALYRLMPAHAAEKQPTAVERGRSVYISEGCIHCHSQFVRPNSPDVLMWGPAQSMQQIHAQQPPLIGNRRQGPDLAHVGSRRSPLWLKAHLINPAEVSGGSIMPPFAFLFRDQRGDDLVAYLANLHDGDTSQQLAVQQTWQPAASNEAQASASEGQRLYQQQCATCHDAAGPARQHYQTQFREQPANLLTGPFQYVHASAASARSAQLSQISKFGIPGTDMPGHEYLSDRQIASLTLFLMQSSVDAASHP